MKGDDWPIAGYVDRLSVEPGDTLNVMVSTSCESYFAGVVRLGGERREPVEVPGAGVHAGRFQPIFPGSYVAVPHSELFDSLDALDLRMWIYPTMPDAGRVQGLVAKWSDSENVGWGLYLDETGALMFQVGTGVAVSRFSSRRPLQSRQWSEVACAVRCPTGLVRLTQSTFAMDGQLAYPNDRLPVNQAPVLIGAGRWVTAGRQHAAECFDGKIENPSLSNEAKVLASWDFSTGLSSAAISDSSPSGLHGVAVNLPMRAVTGHSWGGQEMRFTDAPAEYSAIHFHSDDLSDAGWDRDVALEIPAGLPSGAYAVSLSAGTETVDIPFFVVPESRPQAQIVFLAPTFTYLAYANDHFWSGTGTPVEGLATPDPADTYVAHHPEVGRGLYDRHADGSGCCYSSRLRPLLNLRPDYRNFRSGNARNFSADVLLLQWLERKGWRYDVITDEVLHVRGTNALSGYRVAITGSHPEYCTGAMLDAIAAYIDGGGRLMYLGGNGFYWVTSMVGDSHQAIEVRRGVAGTRTWSSEAGEHYHSSTGELGGLWRHRGRAPNRLVGVGFSAMGDGVSGYRRLSTGLPEHVEFALRGVGPAQIIGEFGAAGDEVDRFDVGLGSPADATVLASATDLHGYVAAVEDQVIENRDEAAQPLKRADMVYFELPGGGAVFSVGSINWIVSLGHDHDRNSVSQITENVLRRFLAS